MLRLATCLPFILLFFTAPGQELQFEQNWWGSRWTLDGERVKQRVLKDQLKTRPAAYEEYRKWEAASGYGRTFLYIGGTLAVVASSEDSWPVVGVSVGVFAGGLVLVGIAPNHARKTLEAYQNSGNIGRTEMPNALSVCMGVSQNGLGVMVGF